MKVSTARIARDLADVNRFGATAAGGAERLAWTDDEVAARRWLSEACADLGLDVEQDEAGNVWAHPPEARGVYLGSHLDTVPDGGRFDGALGVIGALEVLRSAREANRPEARRLGLVCFTDEEGARFGIGMLGSRSLAGVVELKEVERAVGTDGARLPDVLRHYGIDPSRLPLVAQRRARVAAYLELHIEQGPRLEREGLAVGIVTGIVGVSNWRVRVNGIANHAGATMPADRHDALIPVAELALAAQRSMRAHPADLVATAGDAGVIGGASNIVPGRAHATLDIRSLDEGLLATAVEEIVGAGRRSAQDNGCEFLPTETKRMPPALMSPLVMDALDDAARDEGIPTVRMSSKAAHDGMNLANAGVPCGMVFVRSQGGISHAPAEFSSEEDCGLGAQVLARGAIALARTVR